jgi:hypothetical protein
LLTSSVVALVMSGCSISFGSGSSSSPSSYPYAYSGGGKPVASYNAMGRVDDREKPLPGVTKAPGPHRKPSVDPTPAPTRDEPAAPKRIKKAPKRTKPTVEPTRTPAPSRAKPEPKDTKPEPTATRPSRDGSSAPTRPTKPSRATLQRTALRKVAPRPTR